MITNEIIKIASNTANVGLTNKYTFKSVKKNSICGDLIKIELISTNSKINSMKYETESCVYCEASASLLAKKIKKFNIKDIKNDFALLKKISKQKNIKIPQKYSDFKQLLNSDNLSRLKCIFLPFDAVIKALKL